MGSDVPRVTVLPAMRPPSPSRAQTPRMIVEVDWSPSAMALFSTVKRSALTKIAEWPAALGTGSVMTLPRTTLSSALSEIELLDAMGNAPKALSSMVWKLPAIRSVALKTPLRTVMWEDVAVVRTLRNASMPSRVTWLAPSNWMPSWYAMEAGRTNGFVAAPGARTIATGWAALMPGYASRTGCMPVA